MKRIFAIAAGIIALIGFVFGREAQIEWTIYLGFPLVIVFGAVGITFITKRIEAIIGGIIVAALWPLLWESFQTAVSTLP